jgi:hypothetical protein
MRKSKAAGSGAVLFILVAILASGAQQPWKGKIYKEGDVTVVKNPKEPIYKDPVLSLKEDFSIGGAGATGATVFSYLRDIAVDQDGNIYALDLRDCCIKVFDRAAKYVKTIGRRGQGPGELGGPFSLTLLPSKAEIFVHDVGNSRISVFNTSGAYLRQMPVLGHFSQIEIDSSENIYTWAVDYEPGAEHGILKKMNPDMSRTIAEIVRQPVDASHNPFRPREYWMLDERGFLIFGNAKTYEIRYYNPDGKLIRRVLRDYEPLKVTKEDITEFANRPTPSGFTPSYDYSTHHAAYRSFFVDDQGHLFVQTWERTPGNRQDIYDIFDADGRFIGRITLGRHADLINPKPRFIHAGKLYTIEPDQDGFEVIKRYSITWKIS